MDILNLMGGADFGRHQFVKKSHDHGSTILFSNKSIFEMQTC